MTNICKCIFISCSKIVFMQLLQSLITLQARVQEFVRGGAQNLKAFFFAFQFFRGWGPAQKIAEKMIFSTKKVAKYR